MLSNYSAVLEVAPRPAVLVDNDGTILFWNREAVRVYGYEAEFITGRPFRMLFAEEHASDASAILCKLSEGKTVDEFRSRHISRDGTQLNVSINASPEMLEVTRGPGRVVFIADESRSELSEQLLTALREQSENRLIALEAAGRVALDILANRAGVEALRHIAEAARTLTTARYAAIGVRHQDGRGLSEFVTAGISDDDEAAVGPHPQGHGVLGEILKQSEALRIDDLSAHPLARGFPPNHPVMRNFLGVPIRRGETVIGSLYLADKVGGPFTEADIAAVESLSAHAAVAIHHLQMLSRQRALLSGLINAQEEERRAVAYDLHDGLTQYVMAAHMHMEAFRRAREAGNVNKASRDCANGVHYLKDAVIESRRLINGLRSLALDDLGLAGAVEQNFTDEKVRAGWIDAELTHNIYDRHFDKSLETAVYRVVQEALSNVRKHAATNKVRVSIMLDRSTVSVTVQDWGRGFVPEDKASDHAHVGLHGMAERVGLAGGSFSLESAPGAGVTVRASIPLIELQ